jgi:glycine reductase
VVQPRLKVGGAGPDEGTLRVLANVAIATCGPIVGFQEGIIDMSGPGAAYTPFSQLSLIVLELKVAADLTPHDHETVLREAGLAAAQYLARICADAKADAVEEISWGEIEPRPELPCLAYVYMVLSQGLLHDTYILGENAMSGLPRVVDPRIALANGVVSGNCVSACDKNTTYHHQNNPLIHQLLNGHGTRWNFVGVVITNVPTRLAGKEHSARETVRLIQELKADGTIISKEGFGNPDADLMMIVRGLAQAGVTCVALTDEFAGIDGASQSLADTADEADAVVSTGNANERIVLPAMENTIGPLPDVERLAGGYASSVRTDGSMEVELQAIMGATNELGFGYLSCQEI